MPPSPVQPFRFQAPGLLLCCPGVGRLNGSEIDYERNKAAWLKDQPPTDLVPQTVLAQLDQFEGKARRRGVTHTTFRHLTEALNLNGSQRKGLRQLLISSRPEQYTAPLWHIPTEA